MVDFVYLIPFFPLLGVVTLMAMGRRLGEPAAGYFATLMCFLSFASTVVVFFGIRALDLEERQVTRTLFEWVPAGDFNVNVGFLVDPLSVAMMLFVTGIGSLIHLYSVSYMHGDENFSKFFLYLNMFIFSMLILVLGDNLLLTFFGWEGVGACSYFLVSFWYTKEKNSQAGKKAFITNRVGDWGFMVAIFLTFASIGSIDYLTINGTASQLSTPILATIVLLLFVGVMGKSAQFPLYLWLPDAMAGPTPVSALIHAATMVTSGVYLLTRVNGLVYEAFIQVQWVTNIIAWVGVGTAFFAATIAIAQTDIKRVLAYSTVSQLGYMVLAVGSGVFVAAIFHMITHAFFKALLFLGSGSVIHGMDDDQDMRRYGGLRKLLPITSATFIIGWLAIAGVPPFSGFWSKDEILLSAWDLGGWNGRLLWFFGLITAMMTGFYMSRQVFLTFYGNYRFGDPDANEVEQAWTAYVADAEGTELEMVNQADEAEAAHQESIIAFNKARKSLADARVDLERASDEEASAAAQKVVDTQLIAFEKAEAGKAQAKSTHAEAVEAVDRAREGVSTAKAEATNRTEPARGEPLTAGIATDFLPEAVAKRAAHHPHEAAWQMTVPLVILAFLAMFGGLIQLPFTSEVHFLENWLEPSLTFEHSFAASATTKVILAIVAIIAGGIGMMAAVMIYLKNSGDPKKIEKPILLNGWNYDKAVSAFMGGPGAAMFNAIAWFDSTIVDGMVNGTGSLVRNTGSVVRRLQSGLVRSYALGMTFGSVALLVWFLVRVAA